jgi:SAM-dependent methyltransferase
MADKIRIPEYPKSMSHPGWVLPTDYSKAGAGFVKELVSLLANGLPDGANILDLNAGEGEIGEALVERGYRYIALEQNPRLREILESKGLACKDWRIPVTELSSGDYDLIICKSFLEHVPTWIAAFEVLVEAGRLLKPGGSIVILAPNGPGAGRAFWNDYKHGWYVSKPRLVDMGSDAGFICADTRYTLGWVTLAKGPHIALLRLVARIVMAILNITWFSRFLDAIRLSGLVRKVQKTLLEQVLVRLTKTAG